MIVHAFDSMGQCGPISRDGNRRHPIGDRPSRNQPGSFLEQIGALVCYFSVPSRIRELDPSGVWEFSRQQTMRHAR